MICIQLHITERISGVMRKKNSFQCTIIHELRLVTYYLTEVQVSSQLSIWVKGFAVVAPAMSHTC